jgi:hypothetical protein
MSTSREKSDLVNSPFWQGKPASVSEKIMKGRTIWALVITVVCSTTGLLAVYALASQPQKPLDSRSIAGQDTVFIEEMTWMEVRDALKDKNTTVLIPTGGVEENGPFHPRGEIIPARAIAHRNPPRAARPARRTS